MSEVEKLWLEEEFELAKQLKRSFCDTSGKEKDSAKAAEIIHKIGSIYRKRSPHKISLIKSVGLYNAAIARKPSNIDQIKSDLSEICCHILKEANAKNQCADLEKKAKAVKVEICNLRDNVKLFLKNSLDKIPIRCCNLQEFQSSKVAAIQQLNKNIAYRYRRIMADLSEFCLTVMGKPPCEFAVVAMGSLARCEATPYSDFEHMILLCDQQNYETCLTYFRWYSVIFHTVLLNLQETIIPGLNIQSLNCKSSALGDWYYDDYTSRGVSFDGMMPHACKFPLGRQQHTQNKPWSTELIKPVGKMLEFLSSEADLKNGYHLADILTKTCFVFGNKTIFRTFADGVQSYRDCKTQKETIEDVRQQVKEDLNSFSTRFRLTNFSSLKTINIKQIVYRSTTIFISALAKVYNIKAKSCFDIINEMSKSKKISQNTAHKLRFAIATACEMRLRVYTKMKSQCDNAINLDREHIKKFLNIVGVASTINYFQIAYCLQCEVAKQLNFSKLHFYSDPQLINITICLAFGNDKLINNSTVFNYKKQPRNAWDISKFDFDLCIQQIEKGLELKLTFAGKMWEKIPKRILSVLSITTATSSAISKKQMKAIAQHLYLSQLYDEALEFYNRLLAIYETKTESVKRNRNIAKSLYYIGNCHREMSHCDDSLYHLEKSLKLYQKLSSNIKKDRDVASTLNSIGICYMNKCKSEESLQSFQQALTIKLVLARNEKTVDIASTLNNIGLCYMDMKMYDMSLIHIKQALEIYQKLALDEEEDRDVASTLNNIGYCLMEMHQFSDSLTYLKQALVIIKNISLNKDRDCDVARTLCNIGNCQYKIQNFNESLTYYAQALHIFRNTTLDESTDGTVARTLNNIGTCHMLLHQYEMSLKFLKHALQIRSNNQLTNGNDYDIAMTYKNIGFCLMQLHVYDDALAYFENAFTALKKLSVTNQISLETTTVCRHIEDCLQKLKS